MLAVPVLLLVLLLQSVVELLPVVPLTVELLGEENADDEPGAQRVHCIGNEELTAVKEPGAHGRHALVLPGSR